MGIGEVTIRSCRSLRRGEKWKVQYSSECLGNFDNLIDATKAYNDAAIKHFGEFARLNDVSSV